nr:MAG: hypothetical protein [Bacteriophage sp.]
MNIADFRRFFPAALDDDIFLHQQMGVILREGNKQFEFAATPIAARPYQRRNLFNNSLKYHFAAVNV